MSSVLCQICAELVGLGCCANCCVIHSLLAASPTLATLHATLTPAGDGQPLLSPSSVPLPPLTTTSNLALPLHPLPPLLPPSYTLSLTFCAYSSLLKFFSMVKNWAEMDHLDASFHDKVCALERTYEVASVIFNKYCKEFRDLFRDPDRKQSPAKKRKAIRCVGVGV